DSSGIVAMMQRHASQPVRTFTIGFADDQYDEASHAARVAEYLGTAHTQLYVSSSEARSVIAELPLLYDEPFADSSQIPTFLVSSLARREVTVSLSGDGGDELLAGYNRYLLASRLSATLFSIPRSLRQIVARLPEMLSPAAWDRIARIVN